MCENMLLVTILKTWFDNLQSLYDHFRWHGNVPNVQINPLEGPLTPRSSQCLGFVHVRCHFYVSTMCSLLSHIGLPCIIMCTVQALNQLK